MAKCTRPEPKLLTASPSTALARCFPTTSIRDLNLRGADDPWEEKLFAHRTPSLVKVSKIFSRVSYFNPRTSGVLSLKRSWFSQGKWRFLVTDVTCWPFFFLSFIHTGPKSEWDEIINTTRNSRNISCQTKFGQMSLYMLRHVLLSLATSPQNSQQS